MTRQNYDSGAFDSPIEEVHTLLEEEKIESDRSLEDIEPGDVVEYSLGDLSIEIAYLDSGNSAGFLQSYDVETRDVLDQKLEESDQLTLNDKYLQVE